MVDGIEIDKNIFEIILFIVLAVAGLLLLFNFKSYGNHSKIYKSLPLFFSIPIGIILGFVSGIVGIGGGIFLSPILYLLKAANPNQRLQTDACNLR